MCKKRIVLDVDRDIFPDFKPNKKAQVTIFIILGLLLLLALIIIMAVKKEIVTFKPEELMPTEKGKIENYITSCLDKLGNEALTKIGLQAGYLNVPKEISTSPNLHLRLSPLIVVPFWAYGSNTNIPSLNQIKNEIDNHIENNLRDCLFGLEPFTESYDFIEKSSITANTEIVESKVIFNVHWVIDVRNKAGEMVSTVDDHISELDIKLKRVYDTARKIIEREMIDLKLEDITQDLIALEHPELPVSGLEISCSKKTWDFQKAKKTMQNLLRINIPQLKIKGTDFVEFPENLPYYQNHYVWDLGEDFIQSPQKSRVSVTFDFEESFPFSFAVTPLSGGKMQSSQLGGGQLLSYLCLQNWKFTYDAVYPVMVRVRDETTGYIFNIALTVHLIRNFPDRGKEAGIQAPYFISTFTNEALCQNRDIPMTVRTYEKVENDQGVSYRNDLGDVNITFVCIKYQCDIGQTEYDYGGQGFAGLVTNYPYCVGGIVKGIKGGYKEDWERVVVSSGKEIELDLQPLYQFPADKIKIVKHELADIDNPGKYGPATALKKEELANLKISFDKKTPGGQSQKKPQMTVYGPSTVYHEQTLVITPQIEPEVLAAESLNFLAKADFNYNLEILVFESQGEEGAFIGGYKGQWNVPWDQLKDAKSLTFHIMAMEKGSEEDKLALMLGLGNYSLQIPKPEIKMK